MRPKINNTTTYSIADWLARITKLHNNKYVIRGDTNQQNIHTTHTARREHSGSWEIKRYLPIVKVIENERKITSKGYVPHYIQGAHGAAKDSLEQESNGKGVGTEHERIADSRQQDQREAQLRGKVKIRNPYDRNKVRPSLHNGAGFSSSGLAASLNIKDGALSSVRHREGAELNSSQSKSCDKPQSPVHMTKAHFRGRLLKSLRTLDPRLYNYVRLAQSTIDNLRLCEHEIIFCTLFDNLPRHASLQLWLYTREHASINMELARRLIDLHDHPHVLFKKTHYPGPAVAEMITIKTPSLYHTLWPEVRKDLRFGNCCIRIGISLEALERQHFRFDRRVALASLARVGDTYGVEARITLPMNQEIWNIRLLAYVRAHDLEGTMKIWRKMPTRDAVSYNTLIAGLTLQEIKKTIRAMRLLDIPVGREAIGVLVKMYAARGNVDTVSILLAETFPYSPRLGLGVITALRIAGYPATLLEHAFMALVPSPDLMAWSCLITNLLLANDLAAPFRIHAEQCGKVTMGTHRLLCQYSDRVDQERRRS